MAHNHEPPSGYQGSGYGPQKVVNSPPSLIPPQQIRPGTLRPSAVQPNPQVTNTPAEGASPAKWYDAPVRFLSANAGTAHSGIGIGHSGIGVL